MSPLPHNPLRRGPRFLRREQCQTWEDVTMTRAHDYGLGREIGAIYRNLIKEGYSEGYAAWVALAEYDLLPTASESSGEVPRG